MNENDTMEYLNKLKETQRVRIYTPYKYFQGLTTKTQIRQRFREMLSHRQHPTEFTPFSTDDGASTRLSNYTTLFYERFGEKNKSLSSKSRATGVPMSILEEVYRRGMAAWKGGHRVGATQQQWAYARVHSFLVFGCTIFGPDFDLFKEAQRRMSKASFKDWISQPLECPQSKFKSSLYYQKRIANYNYIKSIKLSVK